MSFSYDLEDNRKIFGEFINNSKFTFDINGCELVQYMKKLINLVYEKMVISSF